MPSGYLYLNASDRLSKGATWREAISEREKGLYDALDGESIKTATKTYFIDNQRLELDACVWFTPKGESTE